MSGGWLDSDRRERLPSNWPELVRQVRARSGGRCEARLPSGLRCPRRGTDADHVIPGDDHRLSNLRDLCEFHHDKKSSREGLQARRDQRRAGHRPPERHPGDR